SSSCRKFDLEQSRLSQFSVSVSVSVSAWAHRNPKSPAEKCRGNRRPMDQTAGRCRASVDLQRRTHAGRDDSSIEIRSGRGKEIWLLLRLDRTDLLIPALSALP